MLKNRGVVVNVFEANDDPGVREAVAFLRPRPHAHLHLPARLVVEGAAVNDLARDGAHVDQVLRVGVGQLLEVADGLQWDIQLCRDISE